MNIPEDLDGCIDPEDHRLFLQHLLTLIRKSNDVLPPECEVAIPIELG